LWQALWGDRGRPQTQTTTRIGQEISQNINSPGFDRGMTLGNCLLVGRNELQGGKILVDILGD